mgnify:CR=1 FL=1
MPTDNPSAGSAEPYWFEWQTGLLSLVELLDADSEIAEVAFQICGTKGWDDVGVRFRDGRKILKQMKHSRTGERITFSDLISAPDADSPSLLRSLAKAWKAETSTRGDIECVLVTNRSSGTNWYMGRPPLSDFLHRMSERIGRASSIDDVNWAGEDERYQQAWRLFVAELGDLQMLEKLAFLRGMTIELDAPDSAVLESTIRERLAVLSGLPPSSVKSLFNALVSNLSEWTCHTRRAVEWIDRERLLACLAQNEDLPTWLGHCEVETPDPFFPSRSSQVDVIRASVLDESPHKIDFLAAEPGAGKTSCISKLARSGAVLWREQTVSVRFYAYRPIRPGRLDVGSDADLGVRPDALWLSLLWQIRDNLRKTHLLAELRVPVWLGGMPWDIARGHVLRIATALGCRWERKFIICIDGIDHAARARRNRLRDFLGTLPLPDAIPDQVRFLLAGQPADAYPEYPFFLRQTHNAVKVHPLETLSDADLQLLWRASNPAVSHHADAAIVRLLGEKARHRTLPTVYAVEDIRRCASLEEAADVLNSRPLADSLHQYYDAIWSSAIAAVSDGPRLAAAFALLRERPTGALLASAFSSLGKGAESWTDVLRKLRPLVRETPHGFELVHNDLRVHLEAGLAGEPFLRRDAASALADHYRKPNTNRFAAHLSLLDLLLTADRRTDFADDFTTDWVIAADSLGVPYEQTCKECSIAFEAATKRQDWLLLHSVACASLTLHRVHECRRNSALSAGHRHSTIVPAFLSVEGEPLPLELWTPGDFSELMTACHKLIAGSAHSRALVVLEQWFQNVTLEALIERLTEALVTEEGHDQSADALRRDLEHFGDLCARCNFVPQSKKIVSETLSGYQAAFEQGWVRGLANLTERRKALRLWCRLVPCYILPWIAAAEEAGRRQRWGEARALLNRIEGERDNFDEFDALTLGWIAARARPRNAALWMQPLTSHNYGLAEGRASLTTLRLLAKWINYADVNREPGQVTEDLWLLLNQRSLETRNPAAIRILIRASSVMGRLMRYVDRADFSGAAIAVSAQMLTPLLRALWCCRPDWRNLPHEEVGTPAEVANELVEIAWRCGDSYRRLLCDLAKERFDQVLLQEQGGRVFEMLWECGEIDFLRSTVEMKARQIIEHLHEEEVTERGRMTANLLHFLRRLEMPDLCDQLSARLRGTRMGYLSSSEWVFKPLTQWFDLIRKTHSSAWSNEGMQLLELDWICERQGGENGFSDALVASIAAGAMESGAGAFEALFGFLAARGTKNCLWTLARAAQDGFGVCLQEANLMSEETALARIALAIALGGWPTDTAVKTVSGLLTESGLAQPFMGQPAWQKALRIAAAMQGLSLPPNVGEVPVEQQYESGEAQSAASILHQIQHPGESSWLRLRDIANLARQAHSEEPQERASLVARALDALEASTEPLSRSLEYYDSSLMAQFYTYLNEAELWRLLGLITAITGDLRQKLSNDSNWAFMVAFSAVDRTCIAHAEQEGKRFSRAALHQFLAMHWKWHGVSAQPPALTVGNPAASWPEAVRRMLLSLTHTDSCETVYMAMCGLRFFAECFPGQIPAICREGLQDAEAREAVLSLAQMWATSHPTEISPVLPLFEKHEAVGSLDERLDAWAVSALHGVSTGNEAHGIKLPEVNQVPQIGFPGDGPLFEGETTINGLSRHNSFARMANLRLKRAGRILGPMSRAFRHMALAVRGGGVEFPGMNLPRPKKLAFPSSSPRYSHPSDSLAGDAIIAQCSGNVWRPAKAAGIRLLIGLGLDPWIASAPPNAWPDEKSWPSDWDLERGDAGTGTGDFARNPQMNALLHGVDLDSSLLLLGAVLRIPTFRRDLRFDLWLDAPEQSEDDFGLKPATRACRTLASWLAGYSFASSKRSGMSSVYFAGSLVDYPNSDLDVTPTDHWIEAWGWIPDASNALRFKSNDGKTVAWFERWIGPNTSNRSLCRQPILSRWVARRDSFPMHENELERWIRRTDFSANDILNPE